jgi:two-component system cell cycle sensor histidine kinase/response regulator CckA
MTYTIPGVLCETTNMPPKPGTETILVVDDEIAVLSLTTMMLTRYGYSVITAASAQEALHLFEVWPDLHIDLLLVDVIMPVMNGVELAANIRKVRPELRVLYFSAYSDQETLRPVFSRRLPYIAKPFTSLQLTNRVREVLDNPQTSSASSEA